MTDTATARQEVVNCENEIKSIKSALRTITSSSDSSSSSSTSNTLEIVLVKVEGLPDTARPNLTVQLSSPIEEGTLSATSDKISFNGVETAVATLVVSAKDADIPLGSSAPHDVKPLCTLDPMNMKETYETELPVAIVGDDKASSSGSGSAVTPVCTVTLKVTYKPSPKDQREELYEMLNKVSRRKAEALENLRKASVQASKDQSSAVAKSQAVKSGFLNSKPKKAEESTLQKLYEKTIGPNSLLRLGATIAFAFKDYIVFFGAVGFMHFKGQLLALPPPV
mmetsp:Transcript_21741/g.51330  ORF Transcript_21741/g.51330 Transcript_21741/m.51330 type:complete len:281 (+) Transcript_21741:88-930(+)